MHAIAPKVDLGDFEGRYKERFGKESLFSASNSYDATMMVLEALNEGKNTGPEIQTFLKEGTFNTVTFGQVKFDEIGGVQGGRFVIKKVEDGKVMELK